MTSEQGAALRSYRELAGIAGFAPRDAAIAVEDPVFANPYCPDQVAAGVLAAIGHAASRIGEARGLGAQQVRVATRRSAAALSSFVHQSLDDAARENVQIQRRDHRIGGFYECGDGRWVFLHTGFPHLEAGLLDVLGLPADVDRGGVAARVRDWQGEALEDAIAEARMCGAMVRTPEEWDAHPQGLELLGRPVVEIVRIGDSPPEAPVGPGILDGMRVLDLTRVLAGPTCARTLAWHGADVLRINSPRLPSVEPFVIDTGHGKRSAFLELTEATDRERLRELIAGADVFSQGYRSGALDRLGFGPLDVAALRPGIVYTTMNCYGHEGSWRARGGWEQLAQTVTGLAFEQRDPASGVPRLARAAVCDYLTGYLAAFGTLVALDKRARCGGSYLVRASLCQSGMLVRRMGRAEDPDRARALEADELARYQTTTRTPWGTLTHLSPALEMSATPPAWALPSVPLGTHAAQWVS